MEKKMTATAALIIAGGLAVGIGLARPADSNPNIVAPASADRADTGGFGYGQTEPVSPAATAPSPAPAEAASIVIDDFAFSEGVAVTPGQTIVVSNQDTVAHTLTFTSAALDTGTLEPGASVVITAPTAGGTYEFFCTIHPSMVGRLTVVG